MTGAEVDALTGLFMGVAPLFALGMLWALVERYFV